MLVKKGKLEDMTKLFLPIGVFQIESFNLDKCKGDIMFKMAAREPFEIVKEKLKVQKAVLEMKFNYKTITASPDFEKIGIDIDGEVNIANKHVPIELRKEKDKKEAKFNIKVDQMSASDFSNLFSKKEVVDKDAPEKAGIFLKAVVTNPSIHGTVSVEGGFQVVLSGTASGITGLGNIVLFFVAEQNAEETTNVAVVADIRDIQPIAIINSLTGKDLSNIPLLKDLKVSVTLEISNGDMMVLKNDALNEVLQKYVSNAKTITKGTKIKLDIPLKEIIKKTGTKATLTNIPDSIFVKIFVTDGIICCQFPDNIKMDLLNALVALVPNVPDAIFEKVLKTPPKITIKKFDVNVQTKAVDVQLEAPDEVKLGNDLIAIKDVQFDLSHKPEGSWDFKIKGAAKIGDWTLEVTVTKKGDVYELNGEIHTLTVKRLMDQFGGKEEGRRSAISTMDFLNFGITDVKISAVFGDNLKLRVTGNPVLFGWDGMFFEGMILGSLKDRQMFLGVVMKNKRLDEIVEKLFKKKILQTSWLSQLTATILISNTDATKDVDFTLPELNTAMKLKKGLFFSTQLTITNDCKGSALCEVAREKMKPGTKLRLEGEKTTSGMTLRAVYDGNGFELGKNLKLTKLQAVLQVAAETKFYFEGEMKLKDPPLEFAVGESGRVEISLPMKGIWKRPFGLKYVAFGNVKMGVAIDPAVPVSKLGVFFSTQLTITNDCKGSALCEVAREKMKPGTKLRLEGEKTTSGMTLRAVYDGNGFELGKNLKLTKLQAVLQVAAETKFYFEGEMKLKDPPLEFAVGESGRVEISLPMKGIWKRPFGLKYVAFGNVKMGVAIDPAVPVSKLELSGEMQLGKIGNGKEIISKSAISFDPSRIFYFYSSINTLTLESISKAFEFDISLPQVLIESGFPEGFAAGFSTNPKGTKIELLEVTIPEGFMLKGLINILGYKIKCDNFVDFPKLIQVYDELSPIKIGKGLIAVSKSKNDLENGPKVFVKISKEEVAVKIQGYVSLLGLGAEVLIDVSYKGFYFYVYGNIFNLIEANVTVNPPYGSLAETGFSVSSCISASVGKVTSETTNTFTTAADETEEALSGQKETANSSASWFEKATERLQKWIDKLEGFAEKVAENIKEVAASGKATLKAIAKHTRENIINIYHSCFKSVCVFLG
ncbi:uncharacterized protein LOC130649225 [Hydractinia symbiolongicarpus]|uniref:uncharacterized protein LOC130649225 n=1 Tax=Hydractinia symbiolongicarpus TaxID=13093 RepID=UPI00254EE1B3|nr:uncharacterized protein LOC130649225 [Hydractinia symbiolongicarpus]